MFNSVNLYVPDSFLHIHATEISLLVWLVSGKSSVLLQGGNTPEVP